jgi:hypothetical protein
MVGSSGVVQSTRCFLNAGMLMKSPSFITTTSSSNRKFCQLCSILRVQLGIFDGVELDNRWWIVVGSGFLPCHFYIHLMFEAVSNIQNSFFH